MRDWLVDIRYAARGFVRRRSVPLISVVTLALGIGVATSIFSLADGLLLRPLPVPEPQQLVKLYWQSSRLGPQPGFSRPGYTMLRDLSGRVFSDLAGRRYLGYDVLSTAGEAERLDGEIVTGNYFSVLGLRPAAGRLLTSEDDREPGAHTVSVIGHHLWQRRFGGDPRAVGQLIDLNGSRFSIVGVAPPEFRGTVFGSVAQVWVPSMMLAQVWPGRDPLSPSHSWLEPIGRLAAGVSESRAQAELDALAGPLLENNPEARWAEGLVIGPPAELNPGFDRKLFGVVGILGVIALLFLATACVNVGGMQLARGAGRAQELSVRQALGASRPQLVRQLLAESLLLYLAGGAAGVLVAAWIGDSLEAFLATTNNLSVDLAVDHRVLAFALALSLISGLLFSLVPMLKTTRLDLAAALRKTSNSSNRRAARSRHLFVAIQFALAAVLLTTAGLLLRTITYAQSVDLGFEPEGVELIALDLSSRPMEAERRRAFFRTLSETAAELPGVEASSLATSVPLTATSDRMSLAIDGHDPPEGRQGFSIDYNTAAPGYFKTLGIPLSTGRDFALSDTPLSQPVAIVNQAFAERFWPGESLLGKRLRPTGGDSEVEVIGMVPTSRYYNVDEEPRPFIYLAFFQTDASAAVVHLRSAGDGAAVRDRVAAELRRLDRSLPIRRSEPMTVQIRFAMATQLAVAALASSVSVLGLLLSVVGLAGVVAYSVNSRTWELGVRRALGARRRVLVWLVLRGGLGLAATGIAFGLVAAFGVGSLLSSVIFGIAPYDPVTFATVPAILFGVALLGCYLPARRVATIDPSRALRYE